MLLVLPLLFMTVAEVLPDAVVAGAGDDGEFGAVSLNATSPSKLEGKQTSPPSEEEEGVLKEEFFTGQRLVNPYVFIETARQKHGDGSERSGRYIQVRVIGVSSILIFDFPTRSRKMSFKFVIHLAVLEGELGLHLRPR